MVAAMAFTLPLRLLREAKREVLRGLPALSLEQVALIQSPGFTRSNAWMRLRYDFLRDHGGRCRCCGRGVVDGVKVNVDHILPRQTHPHLALAYGNLQVLCGPCNRGKGNRDRTDWRYGGTPRVGAAPSTPACPGCGATMRRRESARGAFWGCSRFPACRATRPCEGTASVKRGDESGR